MMALPGPMPLRLCSLIAVLAGLLFFGSGAGCASTGTTAPSTTPNASALDTARVSRVDVPDRIATSDTLRIRLSGTVGPNGCYALARIDEARVPGRVTLTPLVRPPTSGDRPCTMAIVPLDATYAVSPPFERGSLSVTALQKNGTPVTNTVRVAD